MAGWFYNLKNLKRANIIDSIEAWTDAFIVYAQIFLAKHKTKAIELLNYMSTIREAAKDTSKEQWYIYDQQFRLRVSRDHTKNWSEIDGQLWLRFIATKPQILTSPNRKICFDYNFKGSCYRRNCIYMHNCIKCQELHSALNCNRFVNTGFRSQTTVQPDLNRFSTNQNQNNTNNAGWKYQNK